MNTGQSSFWNEDDRPQETIMNLFTIIRIVRMMCIKTDSHVFYLDLLSFHFDSLIDRYYQGGQIKKLKIRKKNFKIRIDQNSFLQNQKKSRKGVFCKLVEAMLTWWHPIICWVFVH
jgi:hypothetical protein